MKKEKIIMDCTGKTMLDLTVVVCCYNSEKMIKDCLESVKNNHPKQIILVDGGSSDKTREIAGNFVDEIVNDQARGLANARNMGIDRAQTQYVCFVGPDNIMPEGSLAKMIDYLENHNCSIVSALTVLRNTKSYWGWAQNIYRRTKALPGYKDVVGTPSLFKTVTAKKYKYDVFMKNSDDTEICSRMAKDGLLFAISDAYCYEIGFDNITAVIERWTRYGRGDYLFYFSQKNKNNWGLFRKFQSFIHPIVHDFYVPISNIRISETACIPFFVMIVLLRYYGWIKSYFQKVEKKSSVYDETVRNCS